MTTPAAALRARLDAVPFHRGWGLSLSVLPDGVELTGCAGEGFARTPGADALHGGVIASLLDTAATFALLATADRSWATVDLRVDYLRPTPLGAFAVRAATLHAGRLLGRARAELRAADGRLCAHALSTLAGRPDGGGQPPAGPAAGARAGRA